LHVSIRHRRGLRAGETHFFAIPTLATPAQTIGIDDAGSGAAAPHVIGHNKSLGLSVEK
jgi:hypothetical protein